MGKPVLLYRRSLRAEHIGPVEGTRGTETSQYPEEAKSIETLLVAASERGEAQTGRVRLAGVVGPGIVKLPIAWVGERPWKGRPERVIAP